MKLDYLNWDSNFFSIRIYKLLIKEALSSEEMSYLQNINADLIYIFSTNPESVPQQELIKAGARLYDKKVTYHKKISTNTERKFTVAFESAEKLTPSLEDMAYQSGIFSRFKLDSKISDRYKELYFLWIKKSVEREIADEVLVAKYGSNDAGFITLSITNGIGKIGLIAVESKFRGLKVGSQLLDKAEQWFIKKNVSAIEVVTQLDNIPACSLYKKNGYTQSKLEYIYHYWKQ